jgi:hydrogenase-1 operon protein HyaF
VAELLTRLAEIPIRIEGMPTRDEPSRPPAPVAAFGLGGGVAAILVELAGLLERLARSNTAAAIDLRSLPMSPQDRAELKSALGEGEVRATVDAEGVSSIREARISGVWWVEHRNRQGDLIAELIEVARVPEILARASDEISRGANALREQIAAQPRQHAGSEDQ